MVDYQLYLFKGLTQKEANLLDSVKARAVELDSDFNALQASGVCDAEWLEWARKYVSLGINCAVRSISKQGGF